MNYLRLDQLSFFQLGGPFGFCAFASLTPRSARLSGNRFEAYSSSSAFLFIGQDCMTEARGCQEVAVFSVADYGREECMNTQPVVTADGPLMRIGLFKFLDH